MRSKQNDDAVLKIIQLIEFHCYGKKLSDNLNVHVVKLFVFILAPNEGKGQL